MARRAAAPMTTRVESLSIAAPPLRMCIRCLPGRPAAPDPGHSGDWSGAADEVSSPRSVSTTLRLIEYELDYTRPKKPALTPVENSGKPNGRGWHFPIFAACRNSIVFD